MDRLLIVISTLFFIVNLLINKCDASPVQKRSACSNNEFQCKEDNTCISKEWLCDYSFDCLDKSDEEDCPYSAETSTAGSDREPCKEKEFQCVSDGVCISSSWVCDKGVDCIDRSDELNCFTEVCKVNEKRCRETGHCVDLKWFCDGERDCLDNSDEEDCPQLPSTTESYQTTDKDVEEINISFNNDTESSHSADTKSNYTNENNPAEVDNTNSTEDNFEEGSTNNVEESQNLTFILDSKNIVEFGMNPLPEFDFDYFIPVNSKQNIARLLSEFDNETSTIFSDDILFTESPESEENTEINIKDYDILTINSKNFYFEGIGNTSMTNESQLRVVTELPEINITTEEGSITLYSKILYTDSTDVSLNDSSTVTSIDVSDSTTLISTTLDTAETSIETTTPILTTIALETTPTTTPVTTTSTTTTTTTPTTTTTTTTPSPCGHGEFFCRVDIKCIPVEWRCDHTEDCWDGSDEANCDQVNCPAHMVQCPDTGQCIYYAWICDGSNDCDTGSDERHCH